MGFLTDNATGEQDVLATFVLQQLAQIRTTVHGLTDEQLHSTPSASAFSLAELLRHTGEVAQSYSEMVAAAPGDGADYQSAWMASASGSETVEEALAGFDAQVARTREVLTTPMDLSVPVPAPAAPWFPPELTHWQRRWIFAHLVAELGRHAGHADIVRESVDGKGSYELNDLAEGKEPVDWAAEGDWVQEWNDSQQG